MKFLIFDAGPIISLTMNGMLGILERLKEQFSGEFILTPRVKNEVIDRPLKIPKYKLEALEVKSLLEKGVFKLSSDFISNQKLDAETNRLLEVANNTIHSAEHNEHVTLIHLGEASCLAFANLCKCDHLIVIDERTTRLLSESPKNLELLMERKLHSPLTMNEALVSEFKGYKFIRSSELMFLAYKRNLIPLKKDKNLLDAVLYAGKFKGTSISSDEIEEMKRLA
jgi:predicted nucleic acid-binding protein